MLPFQPESEKAILARFPLALADLYDIHQVEAQPSTRPGLKRQHVFDFTSGLRLIASRETDGNTEYIHFSFSMTPSFAAVLTRHDVMRMIYTASHLVGQTKQPTVVTITPKGVIHLFWDK